MSNQALTWAFDQDLPTTQKFVLVALADKADEAHSCFPSQATLARMTGATDRTVRNALTALERAGYVTRKHRHREDGTRTSDRYYLAVGVIVTTEKPHAENLSGGHQPETRSGGLPETDDTTTGNPRQDYRKQFPGNEPTEEPTEEPTVSGTLTRAGDAPAQKPTKASRGTRLPDGWMPPRAVIEEMNRLAPHVDQQWEHSKFTDYWKAQPGQRGVKRDWDATYRNWIRKAAETAPRTGNRSTDRLMAGLQAMGVSGPAPNYEQGQLPHG